MTHDDYNPPGDDGRRRIGIRGAEDNFWIPDGAASFSDIRPALKDWFINKIPTHDDVAVVLSKLPIHLKVPDFQTLQKVSPYPLVKDTLIEQQNKLVEGRKSDKSLFGNRVAGGGSGGGGGSTSGTLSVEWFRRNAARIPFISTTEGGFLNLNIRRFLSVLIGAVAGSWFTGLADGITTIYNGLVITPLDGLSSFLSEIVAALSDTPAAFIDGAFAWQPPGDLIAFPIAVGVVLIGSWLLAETWEVTFG